MVIDTIWELWWVLPAAVGFSTIAVGSGVSGALFFSPFFMLVVGLPPAQAIGAGLLTEVFGMGNGLRSYVTQRLVDYATARWLLLGAVPSVIVGALFAHQVPDTTLKLIFGAGLLILAGFLILVPAPEEAESEDPAHLPADEPGDKFTVITALDGSVFEYPNCRRAPGVIMAAVGGGLTGLISAGLPEISTTQLILRCRIPPRVAIATSVFVLAITATVGAGIHALVAETAWNVVAWSIPGVLMGSTLGSRLGKYIPSSLMEKILGVIFALVGALVLGLELLL